MATKTSNAKDFYLNLEPVSYKILIVLTFDAKNIKG